MIAYITREFFTMGEYFLKDHQIQRQQRNVCLCIICYLRILHNAGKLKVSSTELSEAVRWIAQRFVATSLILGNWENAAMAMTWKA